MHVLASSVELRFPLAQSLKAKRAVLKPVIDKARQRFGVAVAEVDHQDTWQRARVGVSCVASTPAHAEEVVDEVERFIWSSPDLEVLETSRHWLEIE